ncbi:MAG: AAA family ATPase [Planctomycetaceae bacterium]|nr:AAA family ATPase [Planctomycetaceae bacterium]
MSEERPTEIRDAAPTSIRHMIGQQSVVEQVAVALDAAFTDGTPMDSALMVGPPGCGKTLLAHIVAKEMASDLHEVLGQTLKGPAELNALLLQAKDRDVVFVDEAHEVPRPIQTALYLALDQSRILLSNGKDGSSTAIPLASFTLLLATTDEYGLLQPLRDRMKLNLRYGFYSSNELTELLLRATQRLGWKLDVDVVPMIAMRSRGTPRLGLRLLQSCRRVCRSEGEETITVRHFDRACDLEQIDDLGLDTTERQYLEILADGAFRLNVIASVLGLPARTVSSVTESFLIRSGLIVKDDQSRRMLTAKGREHLLKSSVATLGEKHD